jgi:putative mRNA 3-end processing factor
MVAECEWLSVNAISAIAKRLRKAPRLEFDTVLKVSDHGLYCPAGDFYIDPRRPVKRAIISHAHADHAKAGSTHYLSVADNAALLRLRLGAHIDLQTVPYGTPINQNGVDISFHPSGHIRGAAQIRLIYRGAIWVVTGDFKIAPDPTCVPYEPLRCHVLITESTFGLPVFRWPKPEELFAQINHWWQENAAEGRTSVLFAYALGKAQRLLAGIDSSIGPIFVHGATARINQCYQETGCKLPNTQPVSTITNRNLFSGALVIAPPSADQPKWTKKFPQISRAFASGWMMIRGHRRRRTVDRGFTLSDHADWEALTRSILDTGAQSVWVTHGYAAELAQWLKETGLQSRAIGVRTGDLLDDAIDEG